PRRPLEELTAGYGVHAYLAEVRVPEGSELIGRTLEDDATLDDLDLELVEVFDDEGASVGDARARLEAGSVLRLRGEPAEIQRLARRGDLELRPARTWADAELGEGRRTLVEAVVAPDSSLPGKSLAEVDFAQRFGAAVLGLRHRGEARVDRLADVTLRGGDSLLLTTRSGDERELERDGAFVIVSPIEAEAKRRAHMPVALAILAAVVGLAAFDVLPIVVTALCGSILLVLTRTLTSGEALEAIRWRVLFLLAGVIPLGAAMDRTGAADLLSRFLTDGLGELGPRVLLAGFFGLSMMLTNVVSNQATAALLAPVAIESGHALGLDPRPLLMAVTFAASLSFMTPIGYQTNTLVYGPGHYRFTDYTKVGTPLNLLFWALATLAIPWFWPF
ncbi:MAG TPA: SLC13 family permease, partial [Polyangiaceae bacterium LLY-WYZ-15_(1-7)]|nr:SLC13 family permease [Polyangiaceae bacterium LLY-WYZ-15_(1-7)]